VPGTTSSRTPGQANPPSIINEPPAARHQVRSLLLHLQLHLPVIVNSISLTALRDQWIPCEPFSGFSYAISFCTVYCRSPRLRTQPKRSFWDNIIQSFQDIFCESTLCASMHLSGTGKIERNSVAILYLVSGGPFWSRA
jgi:hypothetical protein